MIVDANNVWMATFGIDNRWLKRSKPTMAKGVPKCHLDKNCPLQGRAWQHAYWTLRKFIKGVPGRQEAKLANIVQDNKRQELAASRRRMNNEARKA